MLFVCGNTFKLILGYRPTDSVELDKNKWGHPDQVAQYDADI